MRNSEYNMLRFNEKQKLLRW